ncbi:MAG: hypothetical protein O3B76_08285 [Proteobacteria bacterium]|nr:hypothetical protein [Pseudomonadota bacterium]
MPNKEKPAEMAQKLIKKHGLDGAIQVLSDDIAKAHRDEDLYKLSICREVRRIVQNTKKANAA